MFFAQDSCNVILGANSDYALAEQFIFNDVADRYPVQQTKLYKLPEATRDQRFVTLRASVNAYHSFRITETFSGVYLYDVIVPSADNVYEIGTAFSIVRDNAEERDPVFPLYEIIKH